MAKEKEENVQTKYKQNRKKNINRKKIWIKKQLNN